MGDVLSGRSVPIFEGLCQFLDEWALLTLLVADFTSSRDARCPAGEPTVSVNGFTSATAIATGRSVPSFGLILRLRGVCCATGGRASVIEITGRSTIFKP